MFKLGGHGCFLPRLFNFYPTGTDLLVGAFFTATSGEWVSVAIGFGAAAASVCQWVIDGVPHGQFAVC
jgi:hypothetical protein